jgi:DNA-binding transcriptional ArsR family regulator
MPGGSWAERWKGRLAAMRKGVGQPMMAMTNVELALDALGDPTRRRVFGRLGSRPRSVREIADGMDVSRPAVSQHLKVLKLAGLVVVRAEGTRRLYAVDARGIEKLQKWLDRFWNESLTTFKEVAEREVSKRSKS